MARPHTRLDATTRRLLDEYLVVAAQSGDQKAFAELVRRWHRRFAAHAWRLLGDDEATSDVVQSGWLEIARGLSRLQDERAFPAWAYRIMSRGCARHIANLQGRRELDRAISAEPEPDAIEPDFEKRDEAKRLHAAIRCLPPPQRAAVALFHFEDLSIAEIAVALDVPAGTIKTRLMHARRRLRVVLEGEDDA